MITALANLFLAQPTKEFRVYFGTREFITVLPRTLRHFWPYLIKTGLGRSCEKNLQTVETAYDDIGLCDTSPIASDTPWYQLIPLC